MQVRRLFTRLHDTRGLGLANCLAAWDVGVRTGVDLTRRMAARDALQADLPGGRSTA